MTSTQTPAPPARQALLELLDEQCEDYQSLYREGVRQRDGLRADDMEGVNQATRRIRGLLDRIRQRHAGLPAELAERARLDPEVGARVGALRRTIESVLELRAQSEATARSLLEDTRQQLRKVGRGRQAFHGYRRQGKPVARFIDGVR